MDKNHSMIRAAQTVPAAVSVWRVAAAPTRPRLALAFAIAAVSDVVSAVTEFIPPLQVIVDLVTAALLLLVLGRRWELLPALIAEAIPGLAVVPFWVIVVAIIAGRTAK